MKKIDANLSCAFNNGEMNYDYLIDFFMNYIKEESLEDYVKKVRIDVDRKFGSIYIPSTKEIVLSSQKELKDVYKEYICYFYYFICVLNQFEQDLLIEQSNNQTLNHLITEEEEELRINRIKIYKFIKELLTKNPYLRLEYSPTMRENKYNGFVKALLLYADYDASLSNTNQLYCRSIYIKILLDNYKKRLNGKFKSPFEIFIQGERNGQDLLDYVNNEFTLSDLDRLIFGLPVDNDYVNKLYNISKSKNQYLSLRDYTKYSYNKDVLLKR